MTSPPNQDIDYLLIDANFIILPLLALHLNDDEKKHGPRVGKEQKDDLAIDTIAYKSNVRLVSLTRFICLTENENLFQAVVNTLPSKLSPLTQSPYHCVLTSYEIVAASDEDPLILESISSGTRSAQRNEKKQVKCVALTKEILIRAIQLLTSSQDQTEQLLEQTMDKLINIYLNKLDERVPKRNDVTLMKEFIEKYLIPNLTPDQLGFWGKKRIKKVLKHPDFEKRRFLRRFINENWALVARVVGHFHDGQHRLTAGDHAVCGAHPINNEFSCEPFIVRMERNQESFLDSDFSELKAILHWRCPSEVSAEYFTKVNGYSANAQESDSKAVPHGLSCQLYRLVNQVDRKCHVDGIPFFINGALDYMLKTTSICANQNELLALQAKLQECFTEEDAQHICDTITSDTPKNGKIWRKDMLEAYMSWFVSKLLPIIVTEVVEISKLDSRNQISRYRGRFENATALKTALENSLKGPITSLVFLARVGEDILEHKFMSQGEDKRYKGKKIQLKSGLTGVDVDSIQILMLSRISKEAKDAVEMGFASSNPQLPQSSSHPSLESEARLLSAVLQSILSVVYYYGEIFSTKSFLPIGAQSGETLLKAIPKSVYECILASKALCESLNFFAHKIGYTPQLQRYDKLIERINDVKVLATHFHEKDNKGVKLDHDKMKEYCEENYKPVPDLISFFVRIHSIFMRVIFDVLKQKTSSEDDQKKLVSQFDDLKKAIVNVVENGKIVEEVEWVDVDMLGLGSALEVNMKWGPVHDLEHFNHMLEKLAGAENEFFNRYSEMLANSALWRRKFSDENGTTRNKVDNLLNALAVALEDTNDDVILQAISANESTNIDNPTKLLKDLRSHILLLSSIDSNDQSESESEEEGKKSGDLKGIESEEEGKENGSESEESGSESEESGSESEEDEAESGNDE